MKFFKLGLLTLLISLFIFSSCKKPDTIGLAVDSSDVINGVLMDTSTIYASTFRDDSVVTSSITNSSSLAIATLAYYKDPILGVTEANMAMSLSTPSSSSFSKPDGTVTIDSAILVLRYATYGFYGDTSATKYKVNVYQLAEQPLGLTYYNTKSWSYNSTLLGTRQFYARPSDSLSITTIVDDAEDTLLRVPPQVRIPISTSFVNSAIMNADSIKLISSEAFKRYFKGMYFTIDKSGTAGGPGGNFYFLPDSSSLDIYYKADTSSNGTSIDTAMASFPFSGYYASQIKHDYTGTVIPAALTSAANGKSSGTVYMQGLAGLRSKISFPYLATKVKELIGNATLSRAELIVTPVAGTGIYPFAPAPRLTMYRLNKAKQRTYIPDYYYDSSTGVQDSRYIAGAFSGFYNSTKNEYHFIITGYIGDLISGKTIDYGTFLAPIDYYNTSLGYYYSTAGSVQSAGRLVAGGDATSTYKMKLNIIYTKGSIE